MDNDLKSASQSMNDTNDRPAYAPKPTNKPRRSIKVPLFILAVLIILTAGGIVLWKLVLQKPEKTKQTAIVSVDKKPQEIDDVPDAPATETYESTALSVSFKHPKTWKIVEATGGIRVESPLFTYPGIGLGDVDGNFRIYIRQGSRSIDGTYIGRGIAVKPSEKLTYTQPAIGQRTDTLLSSFGTASFDNFSFFLIAGNFQLGLGDTLGPDYGKEPDAYIVAGGYSTPAAVDDLATTPVTLDYYQSTRAYKQAIAIISSLQLK